MCAEATVCVCVCVCRDVNVTLQSVKVTGGEREDHEAGQIQAADCWGKWESAQWLSFMISVGVIPPQNECLYTRQ